MNRENQILNAAKKAYEKRRKENGFSSEGYLVRTWEPEPTIKIIELPRQQRPLAKKPVSGQAGSGEQISEYRTYR